MAKTAFNKQETLYVKGWAILMMLFFHLFSSPNNYEGFSISFFPFGGSFITAMASGLKICVSIFAFISGYGLLLSFRAQGEGQSGRWIISRFLKTFFNYFFCYIVCFFFYICIDQFPVDLYFSKGLLEGVVDLIADALGIYKLFQTPTLNSSWWYMTAAYLHIMVTPLLCMLCRRDGYIPLITLTVVLPRLLGTGFPGAVNPLSFLLPFYTGMVFADYQLFERLEKWKSESRTKTILLAAVLIISILMSQIIYNRIPRKLLWDLQYETFLFPLLFIKFYTGFTTWFRKAIMFLGKHSMTIYLTHTLIRGRYGKEIVYGCDHFLAVFLVLLTLSLVIALLIDGLRRLTKYETYTGKVIDSACGIHDHLSRPLV